MKTGILALGAIGCALWLTMATEPIMVVSGHADLKPVTSKVETVRATKSTETHEEAPQAILDEYLNYLAADFQNAAERAIDGRGSYEDPETGTDDGGTVEQYTVDEPVPESVDISAVPDEPEPCEDSGAAEAYESALIYLGDFTITFYCQCEQCCGKWAWSNSTASGAVPQAGWTVAAGEGLPFGTIIYIDGFGEYCVQDRGVPDGWIDIYVNDHSEIPGYGMKTASVYLER